MNQAERMALHNAEMKLALAENISLSAARARLAKLRIEALERVFAIRDRCGMSIGNCQSSAREPQRYWWNDL